MFYLDPLVSIEPSVSYPVEGEKVVYHCTIIDRGKVTALDLRFTDCENFPYENGTGITIIIKKYEGEHSLFCISIIVKRF